VVLNIKSDEADRLARQLAAETGETLTEAVLNALRQRLEREHAKQGPSMVARLKLLAAEVAGLQVSDARAPDEIINYDDVGVPC
jgi:antitoxin VapB